MIHKKVISKNNAIILRKKLNSDKSKVVAGNILSQT